MQEKEVNTNLVIPKRQELRFILPIDNKEELITFLKKNNFNETNVDCEINRNIYFNNQSHEVPWDCTLRGRKYIHERTKDEKLSDQEEYFAEIKITNGQEQSKERLVLPLKDIPQYVQQKLTNQLSEPIRPLSMVEYGRQHFEPIANSNLNGVRVTLDQMPTYFSLDGDMNVQEVGKELAIRMEIKRTNSCGDDDIFNRFLSEFKGLDVFPTISKKMASYNYEKTTLKSTGDKPLYKDIKDVEIESKFIVSDSNPYIFFNQLVSDYKNAINGFTIDRTFPYTYETESINYYYRAPNDNLTEGVKILTLPTTAKIIAKANSEIVKDPYNLNCILKRDEVKGNTIPLKRNEIEKAIQTHPNAELIGTIERTRKVIYISSPTNRVYHVSLDRCIDLFNAKRTFSQVEIEYSGIIGNDNPNKGNESVVIEELSNLTKDILQKYNQSLVAKPLRKIDWILNK